MKESKGRHAAVGVVLMQERCRNRLGSRKGTISELRKSHRELRVAWKGDRRWLREF
jgi:hypothetical protein